MTGKSAVFFERGLLAPFLLAAQPIIQLYLINNTEVTFREAARSLLVSILAALLLMGGVYFFLRDALKSAIIVSPFILFFHLFGDISDWLANAFTLGPGRSSLIVLVSIVITMLAWSWLVRKYIHNPGTVNLYFNLLSILFIVNSGISFGDLPLQANKIYFDPSKRTVPVTSIETHTLRPDIYYIILDGYGRHDILQALYGFDNSEFIYALHEKGFYIADQSSSNYIQTLLSVSSSLNMDYLQDLKLDNNPLQNRADLVEILNYSDVRTVLARNGYQTVSFENEYDAILPSADIYYQDSDSMFTQHVTAFESLVLHQSMARILTHMSVFKRAFIEMPYEIHRRHILSTLLRMTDVPLLDGNYFVYAHIIAPHPPFIFGPNGENIPHDEPFTLVDANYYINDHSRNEYIEGYRNQVQYINQLVLETVDDILAHSEMPPIIIIQGDHGPGAYLNWGSLERTIPSERFSILNAYYFPDQNYASLYSSVSPVNSFRVVLNQYFDTDYVLLPDLQYYSSWSFPFDFIEVTDLSIPQ